MDLFLAPNKQKDLDPFDGDLYQLQTDVSLIIPKLEQLLRAYEKSVQLVLLMGHPGTWKSSLIRAINALQLPQSVGTFQVDRYIDWEKVVTFVDGQPELSSSDYVPIANKAALEFMKESLRGKKLVVVDGGGLIEDYSRLCQDLGFADPAYIILDATAGTLLKRLESRGDGFIVTDKETREHRKNLSDLASYGGLRISTESTNRENPSKELSAILNYLCEVIGRRT